MGTPFHLSPIGFPRITPSTKLKPCSGHRAARLHHPEYDSIIISEDTSCNDFICRTVGRIRPTPLLHLSRNSGGTRPRATSTPSQHIVRVFWSSLPGLASRVAACCQHKVYMSSLVNRPVGWYGQRQVRRPGQLSSHACFAEPEPMTVQPCDVY